MDQIHVTQQSPDLRDVTLAILAGGEGSRMGKPKALLQVGGRPILSYVLEQFAWPGPTLLVTSPGRENPPGAEVFQMEIVDPVAGEGPLRGVLTALEVCTTSLLFLSTVDMPGVGIEQARWMVEQLESPRQGVMCRRNGKREPFPLLLRNSPFFARGIRKRLESGRGAVSRLPSISILDPQWPDQVWVNLNHPQEFAAWAATISASPPARR